MDPDLINPGKVIFKFILVTYHNFTRCFLFLFFNFIRYHKRPSPWYDHPWSFTMQFILWYCKLDNPRKNVQRYGRCYGSSSLLIPSRRYYATLQQKQKNRINLTQALTGLFPSYHCQRCSIHGHYLTSSFQKHQWLAHPHINSFINKLIIGPKIYRFPSKSFSQFNYFLIFYI